MEVWKPVVNYEGIYEISSLGRIKSLRKNIIKKPHFTRCNTGYLALQLTKGKRVKRFWIHELVANHFVSNPNNLPKIGHLNKDKTDNDASNLYWFLPASVSKRTCTVCKEEKELNGDNFVKNRTTKAGFALQCKVCQRTQKQNWYLRKQKEEPDFQANFRAKNTAQRRTPRGRALSLISSYRDRDNRAGLEFDLDQDFMVESIFNAACTYCYCTDEPIGCDRIDNKKGHTKDNVVPACKSCNLTRGDRFSFEEMKIIGKSVRLVKLSRGTRQQSGS